MRQQHYALWTTEKIQNSSSRCGWIHEHTYLSSSFAYMWRAITWNAFEFTQNTSTNGRPHSTHEHTHTHNGHAYAVGVHLSHAICVTSFNLLTNCVHQIERKKMAIINIVTVTEFKVYTILPCWDKERVRGMNTTLRCCYSVDHFVMNKSLTYRLTWYVCLVFRFFFRGV